MAGRVDLVGLPYTLGTAGDQTWVARKQQLNDGSSEKQYSQRYYGKMKEKTEYLPEDAFDGSIFARFEQCDDFLKCVMSFEIWVFLQYLDGKKHKWHFIIDGGTTVSSVVSSSAE